MESFQPVSHLVVQNGCLRNKVNTQNSTHVSPAFHLLSEVVHRNTFQSGWNLRWKDLAATHIQCRLRVRGNLLIKAVLPTFGVFERHRKNRFKWTFNKKTNINTFRRSLLSWAGDLFGNKKNFTLNNAEPLRNLYAVFQRSRESPQALFLQQGPTVLIQSPWPVYSLTGHRGRANTP